jgi:hypothetical protein
MFGNHEFPKLTCPLICHDQPRDCTASSQCALARSGCLAPSIFCSISSKREGYDAREDLCVQNPSCFVLSTPWETGLAKVSRTRPLANAATRVRNNMMLHFVHFRSTDKEHRETVGREGNDKQNGAISYLYLTSHSPHL